MSKKTLKAVIFDLHGTLVKDFPFDEHCILFSEIASIFQADQEKYHCAWKALYFQKELGNPPTVQEGFREICSSLGISPTEKQLERACLLLFDFLKKAIEPKDDAVETLQAFRAEGLCIGLISNVPPGTPEIWAQHEMATMVDAALFSCEVGVKKPDRRIYQMAADRLGVAVNEALYVGDGGSFELKGATEAGMQAVLIKESDRDDPYGLYEESRTWNGLTIQYLRELTKSQHEI